MSAPISTDSEPGPHLGPDLSPTAPGPTGSFRGRTRRPGRLLAALVAGVLVALSIPPFGWWPLGWAGVAVLAAILPGSPLATRLMVGAAFGLADYLIGLLWVQEFSVPGYLAVVVVSTLYAMLVTALVPVRRRLHVVIGLPCLLVLADAARDRFPLGGLPLGGLSLGQAAGPLAPVLRLGGSLLLTGTAAVAGVALAAWGWALVPALQSRLGRRRRHVQEARPSQESARSQAADLDRAAGTARGGPGGVLWVGAAAATALAVALPLIGWTSPSGAGGHDGSLHIALVQGGGPRGTRAIRTDPQIVFDRHMTLSEGLSPPLDLVVWPEGVLQSHAPYTTTMDAADLSALASRLRATVVAGVEQDVGVSRYLNEVVAWSPAGRVVGTYVKNHLVPFGEYVPYRSLIQRVFNVADVPYDGIPGRGPGFLNTPAGPLAVMISYEVFFDSRARGGVRAGGRLLVVPTNTASYRSSQVPTQEVAADRLRAWETGRWLVQVTPTGYSDVVGPTGQVIRKSRLGAPQVVEATVPMRTGMTVFDRIGELPVVLVATAIWLALAATAWRPDLRLRRRFGPLAAGRRRQRGSGDPGRPAEAPRP